MRTTDFLVIGGGIVGLSAALALKRRYPDQAVTLLEKEPRVGAHASGRNSGVLHAGFYYTGDSLKARFARDGNRALTDYCLERNLPINRCGKLVVTRSPQEHAALELLRQRGEANGVPLQMVSADEVRAIEPRAKTCERALFSPTTASVDPGTVVASLYDDARSAGVDVRTGDGYRRRHTDGRIVSRDATWTAGVTVNAAGLHADRIARDFGFARHYRILPFKGIYLKSDVPPGWLRTHIYPVPDLNYPFLGVHFTIQVGGHVKIGPTAIPVFWREHYRGLENFRLGELLDLGWRATSLLVSSGFEFQRLAFEELRKYSRRYLVRQAARLADGVSIEQYRRWGVPGIRAQLVDMTHRRLEMDFVVEGDEKSLHVLNAVSPGFTCAIPFSHWLAGCVGVAPQPETGRYGIEGAKP